MASRFWVGGTGTWDGSTTTHWAQTSGTAGGFSVPGSADTVTFDGSSGGGTVTVNTTVSVQSITMSTFTGTLDFATNNNNVNLSDSFTSAGSGVRTLNMGNGTWTITGTNTNCWNFSGTSNMTFNCNSSTIVINNTNTALYNVLLATGFTFNTLTLTAASSAVYIGLSPIGTTTFATLNLPVAYTGFQSSVTYIIATLNITSGTSASNMAHLSSSAPPGTPTLQIGNAATVSWCAFRDIIKTGAGSLTASNSIDLGHNSGTGFTITAPSTGGGGAVGVIGS